MVQLRKVVHVHLYIPYKNKVDWYFGSLKAIYSFLPEDVVGIKYNSLRNALIRQGGVYENCKGYIRNDRLLQMPKSNPQGEAYSNKNED